MIKNFALGWYNKLFHSQDKIKSTIEDIFPPLVSYKIFSYLFRLPEKESLRIKIEGFITNNTSAQAYPEGIYWPN